MPEVPREFSVVSQHQVIPSSVLTEISDFIYTFDRVTVHEAWQAAALRGAPAIVRLRRLEVCFFSAWDFHLPPGGSWQLIEFNDNGSGFIFAAIINALYYEAAALGPEKRVAAPVNSPAFNQHIGDLVKQEARAFFGECPDDLLLIVDDAESLQRGFCLQTSAWIRWAWGIERRRRGPRAAAPSHDARKSCVAQRWVPKATLD
jgi:hypothetical protein